MNKTLQVEQAYFKALGIETEYVADPVAECEYLVSKSTKDRMWSLVWGGTQVHNLYLGHELHVEFYPGEVRAGHPDIPTSYCVQYGDAQWKSKQWAFGMAVVQAATERIVSKL